jgi:hypothetical protein
MELSPDEIIEGLLYVNCGYDHTKGEYLEKEAYCDEDGCCIYCGTWRKSRSGDIQEDHKADCVWLIGHNYLQQKGAIV